MLTRECNLASWLLLEAFWVCLHHLIQELNKRFSVHSYARRPFQKCLCQFQKRIWTRGSATPKTKIPRCSVKWSSGTLIFRCEHQFRRNGTSNATKTLRSGSTPSRCQKKTVPNQKAGQIKTQRRGFLSTKLVRRYWKNWAIRLNSFCPFAKHQTSAFSIPSSTEQGSPSDQHGL